jgi:Domain of unknown function (DUF4160)
VILRTSNWSRIADRDLRSGETVGRLAFQAPARAVSPVCCPLLESSSPPTRNRYQGVISCAVPVVCRLGGIRIVLRSREDDRHEPHFHAMAAERGASIRIGDEYVYASTLTRAELAVVVGWAARRRLELRTAWDLAQDGRAPGQIAP